MDNRGRSSGEYAAMSTTDESSFEPSRSREVLVRELRSKHAKSARENTEWKDAKLGESISDALARRREDRDFLTKLLRHSTFLRLLDLLESALDRDSCTDALLQVVEELTMLRSFLLNPITTPEEAKQARQKYLEAKLEVESAARIVRTYAENAPKSHKQALIQAAASIEKTPGYACVGDFRLIAFFVNFGLFGQKGDKRAYAIRYLNDSLPPATAIHNRAAMIRDFLELVGVKATSSLVRSTIVNGKT
jgi:hypothetical protein